MPGGFPNCMPKKRKTRSPKIQVEDAPETGSVLAVGMIGPDNDLFSIRAVGREVRYHINDFRVDRETYRDALWTQNLSHTCSGCINSPIDEEDEPEEVVPS